MSPEILLSLSGEVLIAVRAKDEYDIRDFIRIKKIIVGDSDYNSDYDLNNDGVIDESDAIILKKHLLGIGTA